MRHPAAWGEPSNRSSEPPVRQTRAGKPAPRGEWVTAAVVAALLLCSTALAQEAVLHQANWGQGEGGLDGWTVPAVERAGVEAEGLPTLVFSEAATSPRLEVAGERRIRLRFQFLREEAGTLYASVRQYRQGTQLPTQPQIWAQHARITDLTPVELGVTTRPDTDAIEVVFSGPRTTLAGLQVLDLGPRREVPPDGKELLLNPGWEESAPRSAIGPESSYFQGPGWMGWLADVSKTITSVPSRVRSGKQALMVMTGSGAAANAGFRWLPTIPTVPDAWYDFSAWVKGEGTVSLYYLVGGNLGDFYSLSGGEYLVSPDEWRQVHFLYNADNPWHRGVTVGALVRGRVCFDDLSLRQVSSAEAAASQEKMAAYPPRPTQVVQVVPEGETRSAETVTLENEHLRAVLSPIGGGRVVELTDKDTGTTWSGNLLALTFPDQPVAIDWRVPFATVAPWIEPGREEFDTTVGGREDTVGFVHTVTGGPAAPFLDGLRIEQVFSLGPQSHALFVRWRLTNTAAGPRLPNPAVSTVYNADAGVRRLATYGDGGLLVTETDPASTRNLAAGWMAASTEKSSLVCVFDVTASQDGYLDPKSRSLSWNYLRLTLPPGGTWETTAWLAPVPLAEVQYADRFVAVQAALTREAGAYRLAVGATPLLAWPTGRLTASVVDYGGAKIAEATAQQPASFPEPESRFITNLHLASLGGTYTVELFNDPRGSRPDPGIQGAPEVQYRPTVPARVLRLPEVGDLGGQIGQSSTGLWAKGMWFQYYPLEAALRKAGLRVESLDGGGGFPEEVEELVAYRLVILNNLGAAHLTPAARAALSQYVRAGGRLLVLGGSLGLGNALTRGTDLEEMLPVALGGAFEVQPLTGDQQLLHPVRGSGLGPLPWAEQPRLYWKHAVTPRPEATAIALAGTEPVLLERTWGHGKVLLYAGTVEGEAKPGEVPVWEWAGWAGLWEMMVERLVQP